MIKELKNRELRGLTWIQFFTIISAIVGSSWSLSRSYAKIETRLNDVDKLEIRISNNEGRMKNIEDENQHRKEEIIGIQKDVDYLKTRKR